MSLLEKISKLCETKEISLGMLGTELGFGKTIYKWDKNVPSVDKVQRIADYFNVSLDYLVYEPDRPGNSKIKNLEETFMGCITRRANTNDIVIEVTSDQRSVIITFTPENFTFALTNMPRECKLVVKDYQKN